MIDPQRLLDWPFEDVVQTYTARDTMLYALGIGLGSDPADAGQLRFVYERELAAFPTMAVVLCHPGAWIAHPDTGVDRRMVLHGEQGLVLHRPLEPEATVRGRTRVTRVFDKGAGKGALVFSERRIVDDASGEPIATLTSTSFCRADGGFGGPPEKLPQPHTMPPGPPQHVVELGTLAQQALIYRLNADYNPLHADPEFARAAGYPRPILHGLCTFGMAAHALVKAVCGYDAARLASFAARFTSPAFPGETISVDIWQEGNEVSFQAWVRARQKMVLDNGRATLRPTP
jgi:acyl dehydratase